jgi:hypothetical protein
MSLISKSRLKINYVVHKSFDEARRELRDAASKGIKSRDQFDIFLSHRYLDAKEVLALKTIIELFGLTVYVYWIDSPEISQAEVTKETAASLREVMRRSSSLLYAWSENASESRWMPWELGYSDGVHGRVAIIPVTDQQTSSESFKGQEYLGIYPYLTLTKDNVGNDKLWVNDSASTYVQLPAWIKGAQPRYRP